MVNYKTSYKGLLDRPIRLLETLCSALKLLGYKFQLNISVKKITTGIKTCMVLEVYNNVKLVQV